MTEDNRSNDRGQLWLWGLVGLAILATIIMLLTDSNVGLKIALLAALWAAAIGAFMVSRSRQDKLAAERELELAQQAHAAELKAQEAELENSRTSLELARAQEGLPVVDTDVLQEIKDELAALRAQLEDLAGREWGYEPAALQAEARRVRELQAKTEAAEKKVLDDEAPVDSELIPEEESPKKDKKDFAPRPSTVDTTELGVVEDAPKKEEPEAPKEPAEPAKPAAAPTPRAPSPEAVAGRVGGYEQPTNRESNPLSQLISERREEAAEKSAPQSAPKHAEPAEDSRGRRRRDENKDGISVAELLARAKRAERE
ncbi:DUF6779 domain-containing protein [Corynebacterium pilosum]|uniref:Zinc metalloprotease n=1 Tax=Corynebacterium pilosum TaxID=35756 RepID=A0A376CKR3_9CORY|nr:DUF6779 domain-containing protein [Corynebacterium pilosum]STC68852.1 Zinc metalloprotease [Corynebacterium pilosum]